MKKWKKSTALFIVLMIVALSAGCAKKIDKVANIEAIITGAHLVMMGNSVHVAYHKKGSTGLIDDNKFAEIIRWVYLDVKDQPNKTFRMPLELAKTVGLAEVSESENDILIQLPENQGAKQAKLSCQINKDDPNIYQVMSLVWGSVKLGSVNKENVAGPRIPDKFLGLWTETGDSEELVDELSIQPNEIEWTRTGEDKDIVKEYTVKDNGETVGFESKNYV
jgi:hypothetical protein